MELILKSNNEQSIEKIIALATSLHVVVEKKDTDSGNDAKEAIKKRIMNFKANSSSSFGDAEKWQNEHRNDRDLPFT
jgi:cytochrome c556